MGLFDSVMGAVSQQMGQQGGLVNVLGGLLANDGEMGGLGGLTEKFNQVGMGDMVNSWIGGGENSPISAEQISKVLGGDTVARIASQLGVDPAQATDQLAQFLPGLIDKLTPQGAVPEGGLGNGSDLMGMLGGLLNR